MCTGMCTGMCIDMCKGTCMDMFVDPCTDHVNEQAAHTNITGSPHHYYRPRERTAEPPKQRRRSHWRRSVPMTWTSARRTSPSACSNAWRAPRYVYIGHRRRHVHRAGVGVPALEVTASARAFQPCVARACIVMADVVMADIVMALYKIICLACACSNAWRAPRYTCL